MTYTKWGNAGHLTTALFNQDRIWVTAKSEVKKIEDMTPRHVFNTLLMLERMEDLPYRNEDLHATPLYGALRDRVLEFLPEDPEPAGIDLGKPIEVTGTVEVDKWDIDLKPLITSEGPVTLTFPKAGPPKHVVARSQDDILALLRRWLAYEEGDLDRPMRINYRDAVGKRTQRNIWPRQILEGRGAMGFTEAQRVKAWDDLRGQIRTFRLDRIEEAACEF